MFRTLLSRRHAEDARVSAFVAAIRSSADGAPALLESRRTDTVQFPRIVLTAGTALTAAVVLASCAFPASTPERILEPAGIFPPAVQQLEQPATAPVEELTGTDAGLVTEPAPSVRQLEEQERQAPTVAPVLEDAPGEYAPPNTWVDTPEPEHVQEQLPEERGGRAIDCPDGTVGAVLEDGRMDCPVAG